MKTSSAREPRRVTPHGNDHLAEAVVLHGAVARPRSPLISCSTATSPPSTSTTAPTSLASTRSPRRYSTRLRGGRSSVVSAGGGRGSVVVGAAVVVGA